MTKVTSPVQASPECFRPSFQFPLRLHAGVRSHWAVVWEGKRLVVLLVGQRKALAIAVRNNKTEQRFSGLLARPKKSV
jgi:hypothetical protein